MANPYRVLGLEPSASAADIKKSYRKLAKKYHPDVNPGDKNAQQKFQEITAAYDLLSDETKRRQFDAGEIDETGQPRAPFGFGGGGFGGGAGAQAGMGGFDFHFGGFSGGGQRGGSAEDIFSHLFGFGGVGEESPRRSGRRRTQAPERGADESYHLKVDFAEAALGTKKKLALTGGKSLQVTIPAGTEDGQLLRLKGQGGLGLYGGTPGDLLIKVHVAPDPRFERVGNALHVRAKIPLQMAILGGTVTVPTLEGHVNMRVPAWTSSGTMLRLKGKGVQPSPQALRGDQYVIIEIMLPDDEASRAALTQWAEQFPQ